ncbi:hypothetical protein FIU94_03795 [Sulfitobacter sp. THAF37]|uniref:hypothetical protein n=1 Tax=Sulfitobacter sp. THAF37 TaxID=2587855 RepID=UPI001268A9BA|nr:hypothetical protein [Sulfitobacter sp. THAF37]QFT57938.1 hypothetical protein FIU94_03795 [Sulfitobacter sp. THAF37]
MTTASERSTDISSEDRSAQAEPVQAELDPGSLAAIRDLLAGEARAAEQAEAPVSERQTQSQPQPAAQGTSKRAILEQQVIARPEAQPASAAPARAGRKGDRTRGENETLARFKAAVTGYRPTGRHIVIGTAVLLLVFRPWLVLGIALLGLFVMVGVFLILGYDGFWRRAMGLARWYARRNPSRAVEMHRRLDDFAMKWDAILDRFPEGSVDGLYLPDFGDLAEADKRHDAAVNRRLSEMREHEA